MARSIQVRKGDCLKLLKKFASESIDLIYLDPPFFTQKQHKLKNRTRTQEFSFEDLWDSHEEYAHFLHERLYEMHRTLVSHGSLFFHCDKNANHITRAVLDNIFGKEHFRSEIIWHYKRWSNSKKGLLSAHQNILFYSKSTQFKFHPIYQDYSETTNVDQILQKRQRDPQGKVVYAKDQDGSILSNSPKNGVPLSDVWEIPFLNPKANERTGYPTQKPILLLERIIRLCTAPGDLVLDPFCGSGTTLVAAKLLMRNAIGIDISTEAVNLARKRVNNPIKTDSLLLKQGRTAYFNADEEAIKILAGVDCIPVQRNRGIDAVLRKNFKNHPIFIRVQRKDESLLDALEKLYTAGKTKHSELMLLIQTNTAEPPPKEHPPQVRIIEAPTLQIDKIVASEK